MKKLFFFAATLFAVVSFSTCSDDDEPNLPLTPASLAGTWQIVHDEGWETNNGKKISYTVDLPDEEGFYWTYTFNKNGTCVETYYENDKNLDEYHWAYSISDNILSIKNTTDETIEDWQIKKLTETKLVLFYRDDGQALSWE